MQVLIIGAGLSGAVLGRRLAEAGDHVRIIEMRDHVGGNCHTSRDDETGVMVHRYGPHIFHTGDEEVWDFVNAFARFRPYRHAVYTTARNRVFSLPINLLTINQFFETAFNPAEARAFLETRTRKAPEPPQNLEEQALHFMGPELYEAFFKGYTQKQWGCAPSDLPASILKRLPFRFDYDNNYFTHPFQGMPEEGYTAMVERMLDHPRIELWLNTPYHRDMAETVDHVFCTGPLDGFFDHRHGRLGYRTLDFEHSRHTGDYQGCPVMNFADRDVPHTRISEHKHFAPWESHARTIVTRETPRACNAGDIPYYPIRLVREKALLQTYTDLAEGSGGVTFLGRLGTYRYLDMDVSIREAMDTANEVLRCRAQGRRIPAFVHQPL